MESFRFEQYSAAEKMELPPEIIAETKASIDHKDRNEDRFFYDEENGGFGVFDGVGSGGGGGIASSFAKEETEKRVIKMPKLSPEDTKNKLVEVLLEAHEVIIKAKKSADITNEPMRTMETTAAIAKIVTENNGEKIAVGAHLGDSRIYIFRSITQTLEQITQDDNRIFKNALIELNGDFAAAEKLAMKRQLRLDEKIDSLLKKTSGKEELLANLTKTEGEYFKTRNRIIQTLGQKDRPTPHVFEIKVEQGDWLLASTDGLHDNLTNEEMEIILENSSNNKEVAMKELMQAVQKRIKDNYLGRKIHALAKADDVTLVIAEIK